MPTLSMFALREFLCEKARRRRTHALVRTAVSCSLLIVLHALLPPRTFAQSGRDVDAFFRQDVGLSNDQIADIRKGAAVVKAMPSRNPAEVFLFGAIYVHAEPETYIALKHDLSRRRDVPNYIALGVFSHSPQLADLKGFAFSADDIDSLKKCKPGDCLVQMPATSIEGLQEFDWSSADASGRINQQLREQALQLLRDYQRYGNRALGSYNDKRHPVDVMSQFAYMLNYSTALPARLPAFYNYLLHYPDAQPPNVDDTFYWEHVKFGLKPTLRIVQLTTLRRQAGDDVACAIAEKQLYSSHYFETALDLSFCIRGKNEAQPGFFLITALGSEQEGLTGMKGSIVRRAAVGRSVSSLQNALRTIRESLEGDDHGLGVRRNRAWVGRRKLSYPDHSAVARPNPGRLVGQLGSDPPVRVVLDALICAEDQPFTYWAAYARFGRDVDPDTSATRAFPVKLRRFATSQEQFPRTHYLDRATILARK